MNNFINFSRHFKRGNLERSIISNANKRLPNLQQYIATHRFPTMPKIIVYSATANSDSFLARIFPFYNMITPSLSAQSDDQIAKRVANQLTDPNDENQSFRCGYLIKGFPFNTSQALMFDRYLNGANLALHVRTQNQSEDYLSSIKSLLGYYEQRGSLLQLVHSQDPSLEQIQKALNEIRIKIKRNI